MAMSKSQTMAMEGEGESGGGDGRVGRCESMAVETFFNCLILCVWVWYKTTSLCFLSSIV